MGDLDLRIKFMGMFEDRWNGACFAGRPLPDRYMEYVVDGGHGKVEGWLTEGALCVLTAVQLFQLSSGISGHIAEIGVHQGRFFFALLACASDKEKGLAVDVFGNQSRNVDGSGLGDRRRFEANLENLNYGSARVNIVEADSLDLKTSSLPSEFVKRIRLFSVDGGHTLAHVLHDLSLAASSLAPGGVIIVDDFFNPVWPEVTAGVYQYLTSRKNVRAFAFGDNKLFLCEAQWHKQYLDAVSSTFRRGPIKAVKVADEDCWWLNAGHPGSLVRHESYSLGSKVDFSQAGDSWFVRGSGWSEPSEWGSWSVGSRSHLWIPLAGSISLEGRSLALTASASVRKKGAKRQAKVLINGVTQATLSFGELAETQSLKIVGLKSCAELHVEVCMDDIFSPAEVGFGNDVRHLGIGLRDASVGAEQRTEPNTRLSDSRIYRSADARGPR